MSDERCRRCGAVGQDRRTLWMACLYEMNETGLPFDVFKLRGKAAPTIAKPKRLSGFTYMTYVPIWEHEAGEEPEHDRNFYTLRVCKRCRGDWIQAIERWFGSRPEADWEDE